MASAVVLSLPHADREVVHPGSLQGCSASIRATMRRRSVFIDEIAMLRRQIAYMEGTMSYARQELAKAEQALAECPVPSLHVVPGGEGRSHSAGIALRVTVSGG